MSVHDGLYGCGISNERAERVELDNYTWGLWDT